MLLITMIKNNINTDFWPFSQEGTMVDYGFVVLLPTPMLVLWSWPSSDRT